MSRSFRTDLFIALIASQQAASRVVLLMLPELSDDCPTSATRAHGYEVVTGWDIEDVLEVGNLTCGYRHDAPPRPK